MEELMSGAGIGRVEDPVGGERTAAENADACATGGKWKRVAMTDRDWALLGLCHEQKFLMFDQAARMFPRGEPNPKRPRTDNPSRAAVRRRELPGGPYLRERLRKLVKFRVLRRVPVFTEPSGALLPGDVGFDLLVGAGRSHGLSRLTDIDFKNFEHDRFATDIRWVVEKSFGGTWKSERVLRRELGGRQLPDGIATLAGHTVAVEAELTRKSTARYLSIFERYLAWSDPPIDRVLYVVPEKVDLAQVFRVVLPAALASPELWGTRTPDLTALPS